ncbi:MAG: undecaprenyl/decaprenyl-phosphate alpha-N-acetylglucosaminyl 1-phosphate transferase [Gemmataceae bacterium]|nr:undecaprenyl/decaprenyl-phosphate alpha-N-acetylglucosaminyl 1-phosphate transferase [Gemmataceae bacterium]
MYSGVNDTDMEKPEQLYTVLALFAAAFALCFAVTPLVRNAALRFGLVDAPDGRRKTQKKPIPVAGGVAVYLSTVAILAGAWFFATEWQGAFAKQSTTFLALLAAGSVLVCIGMIDDFRGMRGRYKLLGQVAAAAIVIAGGVYVQSVTILDVKVELGILAWPFTLFWLLGAINSLNLIDGMDGLLGTIGLILCVTIGGMAFLNLSFGVACVAVTLAGALLAFLGFNFPPASIYLGDAGSMLIGLVIGTLAIQASLKGPATVALAAPLALLAIPIFDTSAAILRRKLTGRSIFTTDRGHFHHVLLRHGFSNQKILFLVVVLCTIAGAGALVGSYLKNEFIAFAAFVAVLVILLVSRLFGIAELSLVKEKISAFVDNVRHGHVDGKVRQIKVHLQGSADWETLWQELTVTAEELQLKTLTLDVNAPVIHEGYHARWERSMADHAEVPGFWRAEMPLTVRGQVVGRLDVVGLRDEESAWPKLAALAKVVASVELTIEAIMVEREPARLSVASGTVHSPGNVQLESLGS